MEPGTGETDNRHNLERGSIIVENPDDIVVEFKAS